MSKLKFKYDDSGNSRISAFAYNTGHLIEELIKQETNNLKAENQLLEAKILGFHNIIDEKEKAKYSNYFGIVQLKRGKLK